MTWEEWLEHASDYLIKVWGLSNSFAPSAAKLLGYMYYYGLNPRITSGLRTPEKQAELQRRYEQGDPGIVYPPSKNSKHLKGNAVDISTNNPTVAFSIAAALGIRTVKGDRVHFMI